MNVLRIIPGLRSVFRCLNLIAGNSSNVTLLFILSLTAGCSFIDNPEFKFDSMLVEYAVNPAGIDICHPRFSWIVTSGGKNKNQKAYRITVASSLQNLKREKTDMWDSGINESDETIQHDYIPDNLLSDSHYFWKVTIWDCEGKVHVSQSAEFGTAFLPGYQWSAKWIGNMPADEPVPPNGFYKDIREQSVNEDTVFHDGCSLLLRHVEKLNGKIESAKAYVTGLGYYEFYINGQRAGDHVLSPAKTPYHKYVLYDTYDVTTLLRAGLNSFGIHLGNGWYNPYKKWWNEYRMQWFGSKRAIAQINIKFTNGRSEIVSTDGNWVWSHGPIIYNCIYDGEVSDANLDQDGWTEPQFDDSSWKHVSVYDNYSPRLASQRMPPIKVHETFKPHEIKVKPEVMRVFDMGQNFAGWVWIEAKGAKNSIMKIRFAEDLKPDSTIDITSNENAHASAEYILKGNQSEIYEPVFTWFGFRYLEVTFLKGPVDILNIEGRAVWSANPVAGQFECSDLLVNKIHKATVWSQKSNMMGYPGDCPQRDERLGWMGDAQVTAEEAMFNFNMALFYENWFEGIRENQDEKTGDIPIISPRPYIHDEGVEWSSTYLTMLWQFYTFYGDKRILSHHYSVMKRYLNFLDSISDHNMIVPKGWIGDWGSLAEGWKEGDPCSVPTAFYFLDAKIMSEVAEVLEINRDKEYFMNLADRIKAKYNLTYLDTLTASYNDGSQMANSFPLYLGIVPESLRTRVLDNLVRDIEVKHNSHLTTGVLGTKYMPEALASEGRADIAWKIVNQQTAPCWNVMMNRYTTMCEFWTLKQSKNHVMMGSIDAWFYKYIAGIRPDASSPAFSSFSIKPLILDSLYSAKATIQTIRGTISSQWTRDNYSLSLTIEVPFNTHAEVYLPGDADEDVKESGGPVSEADGVEYLGYRDNCHIMRVSSGRYLFTIRSNR
jgi:alpha-L-rhamnosidase